MSRFHSTARLPSTGRVTAKNDMSETAEINLAMILRAVSRLTDAELLQLRAAARKEAEKRGLKASRHGVAADTRRH